MPLMPSNFEIRYVSQQSYQSRSLEEPKVSQDVQSSLQLEGATQLTSLGNSLVDQFEHTGDDAEAISSLQRAVDLTTESHGDLPKRLNKLGNALMCRFERKGDLNDISEAVSCLQRAIRLTPEGHSDIHMLLNNLGTSLQYRFEYTEDLADISEAILYQRKAILLTPDGHADFPGGLNNLGCSLLDRFERSGDLADISEAISYHQKAVALTPEGHEDLPGWLSNLGNCFMHRFRCTGDLSDISEAVSCQQKAVNLTPDGHTQLPGLLNNLGHTLMRRFQTSGAHIDISEAISYQSKAVNLTAEDHASLPMRLNNLGNSLQHRFQCFGDLNDISEAITYQQKAVHLTSEDHADFAMQLSDLGNSLMCRFQRIGDLTDISEAILFLQKAVYITPEGHADLPGRLNNLGNLLQGRFERIGILTDISEAILCQQKAVHLTPEGYIALPGRLSNLGISLDWRFKRTGDIADISEAIACKEKAVCLTLEGHAELPSVLNNLGSSLMHRFHSTGDIADISKAISALQKTVNLTPEGQADLPARLSTLGVSLMQRFQRVGDLTDISEAISCQRKAVHLTPEDHADLPAWLNNLGHSLKCYSKKGGSLDDLSEAISCQQKAIDLTPEGHATLALWLSNLANSLIYRFLCKEDLDDIQKALSSWRQSASSPTGLPSIRLTSAKEWARWSKYFDPSQVLDAYGTVINLASEMAGLEYTIQKRYTYLLDISELSTSAVAAAFDFEKNDLALEWLEQGRCLVWSQLNNLRTDLDALQSVNPALAGDILRVSGGLQHAGARAEPVLFVPGSTMAQKASLQEEVNTHVKLAQEWDQLLSNVRIIPGFEDFLRPPSCSALLKQLPKSGAVVVVNIHKERSDALVLIPGYEHPVHIPLPKFSFEKSSDLRSRLNAQLHHHRLRMRSSELDPVDRGMRLYDGKMGSAVKDVLCQLWDLVVKPIFDKVGYLDSPSDERRIWWCNTGPLAFLPVHAAGVYADIGSITVSDFAISSYIPTVSTLIEKLKRPRERDEKKMGLFMISQPDTPTLPRIPGTIKEVRSIEQLLKSHDIRYLSLESRAATIDQGLEQMEAHSCIHFACHASQDTKEPLESGFYLYDGKLDLLSVIGKRFSGADLAFLSACQTSTGDEKLSEEAVHLAAGMLAAGYRGVVATMWAIQDSHGPEMAAYFYSNLLSQKGGEMDRKRSERLGSDGAARALHLAIKAMRKTLGVSNSALLAWVPYVHFGL